MKTQPTFRHIKIPLIIIFSFILGSMFTISITPIDRNCKVQNNDREHNIMKDSKLKNPDLIILIMSAPRNIDKRNTIRETWLKLYKPKAELFENEYKTKHYFVIGNVGLNKQQLSLLNDEQSRHEDLLLIPVHDTYRNLANKIKRSFEWLDLQYDYGLVYKFVLKCDDDSFVVVPKLIEELQMLEILYLKPQMQDSLKYISDNKNEFYTLNVQVNNKFIKDNTLGLYWGYFSGNARIKMRGKWKENDWIYSDRYLPYALGGGYLLSKNLASIIGKNANHLRWSYLFYQLISYYTFPQSLSLYDSLKCTLMIFQNAAFLEIIHCAIRIVPSNTLLTFFQVMSRILIVCGVLMATDAAKESIGLPTCLFAWGVTEIIRYATYTLGQLGSVPYFLKWLRYSLFVFLYPIGITGELLCLYAAQEEVRAGNLYSIQMPNAYNFNFNYQYFLIFAMSLYLPIFPQLYSHMFIQRKKVLGPQRPDQKSK